MVLRICFCLLIVATLTLAACSDSEELPTTASPQKVSQESLGENPDTQGLSHAPVSSIWSPEVMGVLQGYAVDCEECHPSVATFVSFRDFQPANCGGTPVAPNRVLTAKHCLPKAAQKVGGDCTGSYFLFPKVNDLPAISIQCLSVEAVSPDYPQLGPEVPQPDWAIVTLAGKLPHKRVAPQHQGGVKDGQEIIFFKPMYNVAARRVLFKRYFCTSFHASDLEPTADAETAPLLLVHCDRMFSKGFSGFGFFNAAGELVGNQSHIVDDVNQRPEKSHHAVGSNLACILDRDNPKLANACTWTPEKRRQGRGRIIHGKILQAHGQLDKAFTDWLDLHPQPIKWEKVDVKNLDPLPAGYREMFAAMAKKNHVHLDSDQSVNDLTALHFPYYPSCFTEFKTEFDFPVVSVAVVTSRQERKFKVKFSIAAVAGTMLLKEGRFIVGPTQKVSDAHHLVAEDETLVYSGIYSKEVDIKPCE